MSQEGPHNELLPTQAENEKMLYVAGREDVKAQLPMLFTSRGNIIKLPADTRKQISGKTLPALLAQINFVKGVNNRIVLRMPYYTVVFDDNLSAQMRAFGIVEDVILAGYALDIS